jgi:hypothetical protein
MSMSSVLGEREAAGTGIWEPVKIFRKTRIAYAVFAAGLQIRWGWGAVEIEAGIATHQKSPDAAIPPAEAAEAMSPTHVGLGFEVHF